MLITNPLSEYRIQSATLLKITQIMYNFLFLDISSYHALAETLRGSKNRFRVNFGKEIIVEVY
jgi:hypothetical protein